MTEELREDRHVACEGGIRAFSRRLGAAGPGAQRALLIPNGIATLDDFVPLARGRTLIAMDLRNRGLSDAVSDPALLAAGIRNDVDDIDCVRRAWGFDRIDLLGHSYVGLTAVLYALLHPAHTGRVVQVGAMSPHPGKAYPLELTAGDSVLQEVSAALGALQKERGTMDDEAFCREFWLRLRRLFVTRAEDAHRADWGRCGLANERGFNRYWISHIVPSLQAIDPTALGAAQLQAPVLTIHGARDRSVPFGAALDWVALLPNAQLVRVEDGGHAPWIEAPEQVFGAIEAFLTE
jgi:pimeloyl-ACP methyl ester carboxylesterase